LKLARGRLSRRGARHVIRHLIAGCADCDEIVTRAGRSVDYTAAFSGALNATEEREAALSREKTAAPGLLSALTGAPAAEAQAMAEGEPRFHTWALCEHLLDTARELGFQDPGRALELARLGVVLAERIPGSAYGEERVRDLGARAWALLGNAERIQSDFRAAEKSFARAERLLDRGTGDPIERASLYLAKASLYGNQQRFREAFRLLDRVMAIGRRCGDPHLQGKALITRGFLLGLANDQEAAIRLLSEGIEQVAPGEDPRLLVAAHHNLTLYLAESGRFDEALGHLERTRPLYLALGDRMNLLRLEWLEGKIATSLGDLERAEALLQPVREELAERRLGLDFALLCLDLARIYARQHRGAEMRRMAEEMLVIFRSRDAQRESIAALLIFQQAAEMERVTLGLVQELSEHLKECRAVPGPRSRGTF
jgi:tetratricopeptide (TPR) repeat protein